MQKARAAGEDERGEVDLGDAVAARLERARRRAGAWAMTTVSPMRTALTQSAAAAASSASMRWSAGTRARISARAAGVKAGG